VVEHAETYLRAHLNARVPLSKLCLVTGLSERGLRNAFYRVHGVGPKRWMLAERLQRARRALSEAGSRPTTVTRVATDHGFYELGQFAAVYRRAFGEVPSETLRGTAGNRSLTSTSKGHPDAGTR
jgi:AraC family ethanolamine operon transcriptional activator